MPVPLSSKGPYVTYIHFFHQRCSNYATAVLPKRQCQKTLRKKTVQIQKQTSWCLEGRIHMALFINCHQSLTHGLLAPTWLIAESGLFPASPQHCGASMHFPHSSCLSCGLSQACFAAMFWGKSQQSPDPLSITQIP